MWQQRILFSVPYPAYRLLIDFLRCDKVFCNDFIPVVRLHEVILYVTKQKISAPIGRRATEAIEDKQRGRP